MKNVFKTTAAVITLTAVFAGPASAMVSKGDLNRSVLSAIGADSNVVVHEKNGVVTITGYYSDAGDQANALRAAEASEGVNKVINLARQSS